MWSYAIFVFATQLQVPIKRLEMYLISTKAPRFNLPISLLLFTQPELANYLISLKINVLFFLDSLVWLTASTNRQEQVS